MGYFRCALNVVIYMDRTTECHYMVNHAFHSAMLVEFDDCLFKQRERVLIVLVNTGQQYSIRVSICLQNLFLPMGLLILSLNVVYYFYLFIVCEYIFFPFYNCKSFHFYVAHSFCQILHIGQKSSSFVIHKQFCHKYFCRLCHFDSKLLQDRLI